MAGIHRISEYVRLRQPKWKPEKRPSTAIRKRMLERRVYERTYAPAGERAYIAVPLMRDNRWLLRFG